MFQRSAEPVELGDDDLITCAACDGEGSFQFGSAGQFPGGVVDEDLFATGRGERIVLRFGVLIAGGDPPVISAYSPCLIASLIHQGVLR